MKKIFLGVATVLALGLVSCDNGPACYEITVSAGGYSTTTYVYGTEEEVDAAVAEAESQVPGVEVTSKKVSKAESECY